MNYQIRALNLGEVLDTGVNLIKNHFGVLFGILAVSVIPMEIIGAIVIHTMVGDIQAMARTGNLTADFYIWVYSFAVLNGLVVAPLANAASIYAISSFYLSRPVTIGQAFRYALGRWGAMVWTSILWAVVVGVGFVLIIPGFLFLIWFTLYQQVLVLEGQSGFAAMGRSKRLIKGHFGTAVAFWLLVIAIYVFVGYLVSPFIPQLHLRIVIEALIHGMLGMFVVACLVAFYFSCRCKHENFDLQLLAQAVEEGSPPADSSRP